MMRLKNKVALVTGGASGLGKAISRRLNAEGAQVVISDIAAQAGAATAQELGLSFVEQDVANEVRWPEVIQEIETRFGQLDILVNNAGILGSKVAADPENAQLADWRSVLTLNIDSVFLGCRAAIPAMRRARGGAIVNISSVAGLLATPYASAYGASKAAVRQFTKSVAQYCVEQQLNIRCNSVHPGNVHTPLLESSMVEEARVRGIAVEQVYAERKSTTPMGDFTRAEDIAATVAFLVSEDARHITGEKIVVDGGIVSCDTYHLIRATRSAVRSGA